MASSRFEPRAEADILAIEARYALRGPAPAVRFARAIEVARDRLAAFPEPYAVVNGPHRLCPVDHSPYILVYRYDPAADEVSVVAVVHASQDPSSWRI